MKLGTVIQNKYKTMFQKFIYNFPTWQMPQHTTAHGLNNQDQVKVIAQDTLIGLLGVGNSNVLIKRYQ